MFVIAETYARFDTTITATLEPPALELQKRAEATLREYLGERYDRLEITIVVRIEAGSTRTWVTIGSVVAALTVYGDIRQSIDYLVRDAAAIGNALLPQTAASLGLSESPDYTQRRRGAPGRLRRLFERVARGELTPDEAMNQSLAVLYGEADTRDLPTISRLADPLSQELHQIARERQRPYDQQRDLPPPAVMPTPALPPRRRGVIVVRDRITGELTIRSY